MTNKTTTVISNSKPSSYNPVNTERCNWGIRLSVLSVIHVHIIIEKIG